jgi:hypothetical protein
VTFLLASREEGGSMIDVYSRSQLGAAINGKRVGKATFWLPNGQAPRQENSTPPTASTCCSRTDQPPRTP